MIIWERECVIKCQDGARNLYLKINLSTIEDLVTFYKKVISAKFHFHNRWYKEATQERFFQIQNFQANWQYPNVVIWINPKFCSHYFSYFIDQTRDYFMTQIHKIAWYCESKYFRIEIISRNDDKHQKFYLWRRRVYKKKKNRLLPVASNFWIWKTSNIYQYAINLNSYVKYSFPKSYSLLNVTSLGWWLVDEIGLDVRACRSVARPIKLVSDEMSLAQN